MISSKVNPLVWGSQPRDFINSNTLSIKLYDKNFKQLMVSDTKENIQIELEIPNHQNKFLNVHISDLSKRKSGIIMHNVTYSKPTMGLLLKLRFKKPITFSLFSRVNEVPSETDEHLIFKTKVRLTDHQQVIPVFDNGTVYIGLKPGL